MRQPNSQNPWHQKILIWAGWMTAVVAAIAALFKFALGIDSLAQIPTLFTDRSCGLLKLKYQKEYKQAEREFLKNFNSTPSKTESELRLWQADGSPLSIAEVIIQRSPELQELKNAILSQDVLVGNKPIFIYGGAGIGKSAVAKHLANADSTIAIDLSELRYRSASNKVHPKTNLIPELKIGEKTISKMADLKPQEKKKSFLELMSDIARQPIDRYTSIIIDGLDELHPNSSTHILEKALDYINTNDSSQNIIFVGRGEAFLGYIRTYGDKAIHEAIEVKPIILNSSYLIRWFINDYLIYETKDIINVSEERLTEEILELYSEQSIIKHFFQTTEPMNILIRNRRYFNLNEWSAILYSDLRRRNKKTHNRPSDIETIESAILYDLALKQAARHLKFERRNDDNATMTALVKETDYIFISHQDKCIPVKISNILNFSGVANLNPFNQNQLEYTFNPIILQDFISKNPQDIN